MRVLQVDRRRASQGVDRPLVKTCRGRGRRKRTLPHDDASRHGNRPRPGLPWVAAFAPFRRRRIGGNCDRGNRCRRHDIPGGRFCTGHAPHLAAPTGVRINGRGSRLASKVRSYLFWRVAEQLRPSAQRKSQRFFKTKNCLRLASCSIATGSTSRAASRARTCSPAGSPATVSYTHLTLPTIYSV